MKTLITTFAFALIATATAHAQLEKLVESVEVRVTNIDVVATDKDGHPVTGLTKDDFQVFEDGKLQPLSNFYEVRDASSPSGADGSTTAIRDPRQRRVIFFIDNNSIHAAKRAEILRSIDKVFRQLLVPGDEATIVTWDRGLKTIRSFTGDLDLLETSLRDLSRRSSGGASREMEAAQMKSRCIAALDDARSSSQGKRGRTIEEAHTDCLGMAYALSEDFYVTELALTNAMHTMLSTLAGVDGKKVLVFVGAHLPDNPGLEFYQFVDDTFAPYLRNMQPSTFSARTARVVTSTLDAVAHHANANGVTMYMIDAADSSAGATPTADTRLQGIDINGAFESYASTLTSFGALAARTGGIALARGNGYDAALQTLARDLNSYYSLGYKPPEKQKEGERALTVTCKRPGVTIRTRRSYASKSAQEQMSDHVIANLFHRTMTSELNVSLVAGALVRQGRSYHVPVTVSIPASSLTLIPDGTDVLGGFDVYFAVGDEDGTRSAVTKKAQLVRVPAAAAASLKKQPLVFNADLLVQKGEHVLSVGVIDRLTSSSGFARTKLVAK
jgi:VWFA-related protein